MTVLDKISTTVAVAGLGVSIAALVVATEGTHSSTRLATEALETSRQANSIALGLVREPSVIEFSRSGDENFTFDFTKPQDLAGDLVQYVSVSNRGKKPVDALAIEVIGIDGLTFRLSSPLLEIEGLPSINIEMELRSALQPEGSMHVDVRKMLFLYLKELRPLLPSGDAEYTTVVNVVIFPKAVNEPTPAGAGTDKTVNDRRLITVRFRPSVLESPEAKKAMNATVIPHRIYDK
jgi:hypothetical protein